MDDGDRALNALDAHVRELEDRLRAAEDAIATLAARLQEIEDERAIRELLARYGFCADMGWSDAYVRLYTEDGAIDQGSVTAAGVRERRWEGHDSLTQFITDPDGGHKSIEGRCMHVVGANVLTHIRGDSAIAESYSFVLLREEGGFQVYTASANRWTLTKVDGEWRISERVLRSPNTEQYLDVVSRAGYGEMLEPLEPTTNA